MNIQEAVKERDEKGGKLVSPAEIVIDNIDNFKIKNAPNLIY